MKPAKILSLLSHIAFGSLIG